MAIIQNALNQSGNVDPKVFAGDGASSSTSSTANSGIAGYNPAKTEATLGSVNFDTDTVEGRTNNILKSGSPLMERAQGLANQRSNERGLINSSLAVGAAQTSMLDAAVPIATTDAATMNQQRLQNQAALNQADQINAENINVGQKMQLGAKLDMDKQNAAFAQDQANKQLAANLELQRLDKQYALQQQARLAELEAQSKASNQTANYNAALAVSNNLVSEINRINADANFSAQAKQAQVEAAKTAAASQINYLSRLSGVDYGNLLGYFQSAAGANAVSNTAAPAPATVAASPTNMPSPFYGVSFGGGGDNGMQQSYDWGQQG